MKILTKENKMCFDCMKEHEVKIIQIQEKLSSKA